MEQKTLSTLRSFLHRKQSTSGASSTVSCPDSQPTYHADYTPPGEMGKLSEGLASTNKIDILPQAAQTQPTSIAQIRMRPFLKRQWSEDLPVRAASRQQQQIELSSPSTIHANKLPFTALKTDLTKRKVPVLRRSISSSQVSLTHAALTPTTPPALTPTTPPDGRESGPVDRRTHIRDGSIKSEGNSPLDGSSKSPIGGTRVATTAAGGVAMEISPDEDAGTKHRKNESFTQKLFQSGTF